MKNIFSFFVLILFLLLPFFHSSAIFFGMQKMDTKTWIESKLWCCENKKNISLCKHKCCYESNNKLIPFSNNYREESKKLKFSHYDWLSDFDIIFSPNEKFFKYFLNPHLKRKIKNYSYLSLVKIIKSNT